MAETIVDINRVVGDLMNELDLPYSKLPLVTSLVTLTINSLNRSFAQEGEQCQLIVKQTVSKQNN